MYFVAMESLGVAFSDATYILCVTQIKTPRKENRETLEKNFSGPFLAWKKAKNLNHTSRDLPHPRVKVPVQTENVKFNMEVDTGAAASILNYEDYERYFKHKVLRPVERSFHAYAGTPLDIAGQIMVHVEHNRQRATLPLLVVRAERYAPPLLGRSWLTNVRPDWKNLFPSYNGKFSVGQDSDVRVERLKEQYAKIFKPELGTVQGVTAKLHIKESAEYLLGRNLQISIFGVRISSWC